MMLNLQETRHFKSTSTPHVLSLNEYATLQFAIFRITQGAQYLEPLLLRAVFSLFPTITSPGKGAVEAADSLIANYFLGQSRSSMPSTKHLDAFDENPNAIRNSVSQLNLLFGRIAAESSRASPSKLCSDFCRFLLLVDKGIISSHDGRPVTLAPDATPQQIEKYEQYRRSSAFVSFGIGGKPTSSLFIDEVLKVGQREILHQIEQGKPQDIDQLTEVIRIHYKANPVTLVSPEWRRVIESIVNE